MVSPVLVDVGSVAHDDARRQREGVPAGIAPRSIARLGGGRYLGGCRGLLLLVVLFLHERFEVKVAFTGQV